LECDQQNHQQEEAAEAVKKTVTKQECVKVSRGNGQSKAKMLVELATKSRSTSSAKRSMSQTAGSAYFSGALCHS
jgi:hypothetical protein